MVHLFCRTTVLVTLAQTLFHKVFPILRYDYTKNEKFTISPLFPEERRYAKNFIFCLVISENRGHFVEKRLGKRNSLGKKKHVNQFLTQKKNMLTKNFLKMVFCKEIVWFAMAVGHKITTSDTMLTCATRVALRSLFMFLRKSHFGRNFGKPWLTCFFFVIG